MFNSNCDNILNEKLIVPGNFAANKFILKDCTSPEICQMEPIFQHDIMT